MRLTRSKFLKYIMYSTGPRNRNNKAQFVRQVIVSSQPYTRVRRFCVECCAPAPAAWERPTTLWDYWDELIISSALLLLAWQISRLDVGGQGININKHAVYEAISIYFYYRSRFRADSCIIFDWWIYFHNVLVMLKFFLLEFVGLPTLFNRWTHKILFI